MNRMKLALISLLLAPLVSVTLSPVVGQDVFIYSVDAPDLGYDFADGSGSGTVLLRIEEDSANPGYPSPTCSFSMSLAIEGPVVLVEASPAPVIQAVYGGLGPDFFGAQLDPIGGPGFTIGVVYDFQCTGPNLISFPVPEPVVELAFQSEASVLAGDPDGEVVFLTWSTVLGDPPVVNTVCYSSFPPPPDCTSTIDFVDGVLTLVPDSLPFLRGDVDGSGAVEGLVDGVFALLFQFVPGSPAPPCLSAADADDDDAFNGLADGLYLLNFLFTPGSPPPSFPYPECGLDPSTFVTLGCEGQTCP